MTGAVADDVSSGGISLMVGVHGVEVAGVIAAPAAMAAEAMKSLSMQILNRGKFDLRLNPLFLRSIFGEASVSDSFCDNSGVVD